MADGEDWLAQLHRAGANAREARAGSDAAFERLAVAVRAAHVQGTTVLHLVDVTSLSRKNLELIISAGEGTPDVACDDLDVRIAAYEAAAADAGYLAARGRRDALVLRAGRWSGLGCAQIAEAAGMPRRIEWELRTGRLQPGRPTNRHDVFEGAGNAGRRERDRARLREMRVAVQAGSRRVPGHGRYYGYRLGCRCGPCKAAGARANKAARARRNHS